MTVKSLLLVRRRLVPLQIQSSPQSTPGEGHTCGLKTKLASPAHHTEQNQEPSLSGLNSYGGTGELLRTSTLPLDDPQPRVWFPERLFLFTGTCAYGTRQRCQEFVTERGGLLAARPRII